MIRALLLAVLGLLGAVIGYGLLFTGGQSRGATFRAGSIHVEYSIYTPGLIRAERLEYVLLSDGQPDDQTVRASDGNPTIFTLVYHETGTTNTVGFSTKPGQTVWIGKDRKVSLAPIPLRMQEVLLLEEHQGDPEMQMVASLEVLRTLLAKLAAARTVTLNRGPRGEAATPGMQIRAGQGEAPGDKHRK